MQVVSINPSWMTRIELVTIFNYHLKNRRRVSSPFLDLVWFWSPLCGFLSIVFVICLFGARWCCVLAMHCRGRHGAFASREGEWDRMAEKMMLEFGESGHPVFRATSPLSRGQVKSKGGGKTFDTLLCRFGYNLKLFFAHLFL